MRSLLSGVGPGAIRLHPFPHILIDDALDQPTFEALSESFPSFAQIGWDNPAKPPGSNLRYQLSAWIIRNHGDLPSVWKGFVGLHSAPDFLRAVAELFHGHWPDALLRTLDGRFDGHEMGLLLRDRPATGRILQDARCEINTPVTGPASSSRWAHIDLPCRIYSGLLYFRAPEDDSVGGDLQLFRWKPGAIRNPDLHEQPEEAVEVAVTIPYRANRFVLFPQSIDALHGVSVRHPTPHTRRYVFITAELGQDWLVSPDAA